MNDHTWQALLHPEIKDFIRVHHNHDVHKLALQKPPRPEWPYAIILDQIKARQKAAVKIPIWLEQSDVIFSSSDTMEQASSYATAHYKAQLFHGKRFVDLTGGSGIDSWAMLKNFAGATIIDTQKETASLLAHNLNLLHQKKIDVQNGSAEEFVASMEPVDLVMVDPQRRNDSRKGICRLEDCTPNIFELLPDIKAKHILLKASPMLDITKAIGQLGCVAHIHVLEWQNECKEVLFILAHDKAYSEIPITAVKLDDQGTILQSFTYTAEQEKNAAMRLSEPLTYLYEPGPAFIKAGGFKSIGAAYNAAKLAPSTHLYTSEERIEDFPGRMFEILGIYSPKAKSIPVSKANLKVRNFPESQVTLKKKLKIEDGGNDYLFACKLYDEKTGKDTHKVIHCKK